MGPDVVIGPGGSNLTHSDWFGLRDLLNREHDDLNRTPLEAAQLFKRLLDDAHTEVWMLRGTDGAVDGFIALHLGSKLSDEHTATLRIHLAADARGKHRGGTLMHAALKWADENGISRIVATPYLDGTNKLGFFLRHGFVPEGIATSAAKVGDKLVDVSLLARVK